MTTVGRWSPNKVRARVLNGTWVSPEELGGMVLLTPTSIAYTGTSATVGANGSVEFTACSSLSLNGVFSADYDNYMVAVRVTPATASNVGYRARLRASGTDATGATDYTFQRLGADGTSVTGYRASGNTFQMGTVYSGKYQGEMVSIYGPYLAQPTAWRGVTVLGYNDASIQDYAQTHSLSTSYDGLTLYVSSGANPTGLVSVYGLVGA